MLKKSMELLTLGESYLYASVLYFGLGLLVLGLAPVMPSANATTGIECEEGMVPVWFGEYYVCQCQES